MQFGLRTLMLLFVILWSALAACGPGGVFVGMIVVAIAVCIHTLPKPTLKEWLAVIVIVLLLIALLLPAMKSSGHSPNTRCRNNLRDLGTALLNYHTEYGSFPPAFVADKTGTPLHSWRVQILPFLDRKSDYEAYRFDKPWNSRENAAIPDTSRHWHCPQYRYGDCGTGTSDSTSYFAVIGPQTAWRGSTPTKLSDLPNGGKRMILLVESADRAIDWKEPKDLTYEEAMSGINRPGTPCISSTHTEGGDYFHHPRRGAYVVFVDLSIHFLPEDISADDLRALLTGDTSRNIDLDALAQPLLDWSHIVSLPLLIASSALLIIGTLLQRLRRQRTPDANEPQ